MPNHDTETDILFLGRQQIMSSRILFITAMMFGSILAFNAETVDAQESCQSGCQSCEEGRRAGSQYRPEDPWQRGRIWLKQTGHFGWFYNCDGEEEKRNSPYLCWKKSGSPYSGERFFECIRCDIERIKQRIADGSSNCCGNRFRKQPAKSRHGDK